MVPAEGQESQERSQGPQGGHQGVHVVFLEAEEELGESVEDIHARRRRREGIAVRRGIPGPYEPGPGQEEDADQKRGAGQFAECSALEKAAVEKIESRLREQYQAEEIMGEHADQGRKRVSPPDVIARVLVGADEEILVPDGKQGEQAVHAHLVSVPVQERRGGGEQRHEDAHALAVSELAQEVNGRDGREEQEERKQPAGAHPVAFAESPPPEVEQQMIKGHMHVFRDQRDDLGGAAAGLPKALGFIQAQALIRKEYERKAGGHRHQKQNDRSRRHAALARRRRPRLRGTLLFGYGVLCPGLGPGGYVSDLQRHWFAGVLSSYGFRPAEGRHLLPRFPDALGGGGENEGNEKRDIEKRPSDVVDDRRTQSFPDHRHSQAEGDEQDVEQMRQN